MSPQTNDKLIFDAFSIDIENCDCNKFVSSKAEDNNYKNKSLSDVIREETLQKIYENIKISQKDIDNFLKQYT
jgi:hypothetical protein